MIDSNKIEYYLRLERNHGDSLISKGASNIRVSNLEKISGGATNDLFSFSLTFTKNGIEQQFSLLLKMYPKPVALWFETYHPQEDIRKYVREFQSLRSLENVNFPVPKAYLCESDSFFLGSPFIIMQKETVIQDRVKELKDFAITLARLHNMKVDELALSSFATPPDDSAFAAEWIHRFKHVLNETKHYRSLRKDFEFAVSWLESNWEINKCPQYCLIHGEYHPGHTIITKGGILKVIDWEGAAIGDPAFDVGYAYHTVKLLHNGEKTDSGEKAANEFVSEYKKNFNGNIEPRLAFYQVVGILGVTMAVSALISHPLEVYKRFGSRAFARAFAFPFLKFSSPGKRWLNRDFIISYLEYCQDFIRTTLK